VIPNDQPLRSQTIERMLKVCQDKEGQLTEWESGFISSISNQFERKSDLSVKQCQVLEKLYDKLG